MQCVNVLLPLPFGNGWIKTNLWWSRTAISKSGNVWFSIQNLTSSNNAFNLTGIWYGATPMFLSVFRYSPAHFHTWPNYIGHTQNINWGCVIKWQSDDCQNFYLSHIRLMFLAIISSATSVKMFGSSASWSSNAMLVLTFERIASAFLRACRLIVSCRLLLGTKP